MIEAEEEEEDDGDDDDHHDDDNITELQRFSHSSPKPSPPHPPSPPFPNSLSLMYHFLMPDEEKRIFSKICRNKIFSCRIYVTVQ